MDRLRKKMNQALLLVSILLWSSSRLIEGRIWSPDIFPNPKRDTYLCGRNGRKSSICDPDSVLSTRAADRVEGIIQDVQEGMSPYQQDQCGSKGVQGYQVRHYDDV